MLRYRTFRNADPPRLVAVWRSLAGRPGFRQPVSVGLFEQLVFGKLHFDYEGLVLAFDDDRPVGFAHASFGPNEDGTGTSTKTGVIAMICVCPDSAETDVAGGLLERCEAYLRRRGTQTAFGGGFWPRSPFYLGLYGGCELAGVLDSDPVARDAFRSHGFREVEERVVLRRPVRESRLPADWRQAQFRRRMTVQVMMDVPARSWWDACTAGDFDLTRFEIVPRGGGTPLAYALVRTMDLSDDSFSGRAAAVIELEVQTRHRRQGLASFLLAEALRVLASQGVAVVEAQTAADDAAAITLAGKFGFQPGSRGTVYRKDL